jgi:hypothetical protein
MDARGAGHALPGRLFVVDGGPAMPEVNGRARRRSARDRETCTARRRRAKRCRRLRETFARVDEIDPPRCAANPEPECTPSSWPTTA